MCEVALMFGNTSFLPINKFFNKPIFISSFLFTSGLLFSGLLLSSFSQANVLKSKGFYVNGGVGWAQVDSNRINNNDGLSSGGQIGWKVDAGYKFNKFISAEIGYSSLSFMKGASREITNDYIYDASIRLNLDLNNRFGVYGKVGVAKSYSKYYDSSLTTQISNNKIVPIYGVGGTYSLNENSYIGIEAFMTPDTSAVPEMRSVTFNVGYIF